MIITNYTPSLGFKVEAARERGLITNKDLYQIGIILEAFFYCQQSLSLPPTRVNLRDVQDELRKYDIILPILDIVRYIKQLGSIIYVNKEYTIPLFAFLAINKKNSDWECWINFNPYF